MRGIDNRIISALGRRLAEGGGGTIERGGMRIAMFQDDEALRPPHVHIIYDVCGESWISFSLIPPIREIYRKQALESSIF